MVTWMASNVSISDVGIARSLVRGGCDAGVTLGNWHLEVQTHMVFTVT